MKIYTIYSKTEAESELIPEEFSFAAAIFPLLWALYKRIWWLAVVIIIGNCLFNYLATREAISTLGLLIVNIIFNFCFGIYAQDLYRLELERKGYIFSNVVSACSLIEAQLKLALYD